jgi:hypothetical protein
MISAGRRKDQCQEDNPDTNSETRRVTMTKKNSIQIQNINNSQETVKTVDVLYQKMGDRWYAFSLIDEEVFVGSVSQDEINHAASTDAEIEKILIEPGNDLLNEVA